MTDKALEAARECPWHGDNSDLAIEDNGVGCFWVVCEKSDCGCEGPYADSVEAAIAAWNRRAPLSALPGEAEVVAWRWKMLKDKTWTYDPAEWFVDKNKSDPSMVFEPLVTLASLQAMQARAEKAERERDANGLEAHQLRTQLGAAKQNASKWHDLHDGVEARAEAAEARVKVLEEALEPFAAITEIPALGCVTKDMVITARTALTGGSNG